ncbi:MAG: hypothetical protein R3E32_00485 [Chitinophagales bacterium]
MIRTYFLQKLKKYALQLLVLQFVVFMICLFFLQFQHLQNKALQNQIEEFMTVDNLQWEEMMNDKLRSFEEKVDKEKRGFDHLEKAKIIVELANKYHSEIRGLQNGKRFRTDEVLQKLEDFQEKVEMQLFKSNLQYPDFDEMDRKAFREASKYSQCKMDLAIQKANNTFCCSSVSSNLNLNLLENALMSFSKSAIEFVKAKIHYCDNFYTKYYAHVIPSAKTLQIGEMLEADIFLDEASSMYRPRIFVGEEQMFLNADGVAQYQLKAEKIGKQRIEGCIYWRTSFEGEQELPFIYEYNVVPKCN